MMDWNEELHRVADAGNLRRLKNAIANGADLIDESANPNPQYRFRDWDRELSKAVFINDPTGFRKAIDKGANLNWQDISGHTALIVAADHGYELMVNELIAKGANLDLQNYDGKTALDIARERGRQEIVKILEEAMAEKSAPAPKTALQKELERRAARDNKSNHWSLA